MTVRAGHTPGVGDGGPVLAAFTRRFAPDDPLSALEVDHIALPAPPPDWVPVRVRAASLNHHDLFTLSGVATTADRLPVVLGIDAAGLAPDGTSVVVHAVINAPDWHGPELHDPDLSVLSERHPGAFAEVVYAPAQNLFPLPPSLDFERAACLPTAYLTAYRMLFGVAELRAGDTVLVQGAGGGVSTAAVMLARAAGLRVWVTGRTEETRAWALDCGAHEVFETGARLPRPVDAVVETVGAATWEHSLRSLRPHGVMAVAGATSGYVTEVQIGRIFARQLRIHGSSVGTRADMRALIELCELAGVRPRVQQVFPLARAHEAFRVMHDGDVRGKLVLAP